MGMRRGLYIVSVAIIMLFALDLCAQTSRLLVSNVSRGKEGSRKENDSIDEASFPKGYYVWTVDNRFGSPQIIQPDTLSYLFQNSIYTEGVRGEYNITGNLGSPRISRIYIGRQNFTAGQSFIFSKPYDYFVRDIEQFHFYNTKSPIAVLNYHSAGGKQNGEDRFTAQFASNVNRRLGMGFNIDYVYGRGIYGNQSHSSFGGTLFGSYVGEQYRLYTLFTSNHIKNLENGGLSNENYITNPSSYGTQFSDQDIPVRLIGVRNRLNVNRLFLTHRYALGYTQLLNNEGKVVKSIMSSTTFPKSLYKDKDLISSSLEAVNDTIPMNGEYTAADTIYRKNYVPVVSFIHAIQIDFNNRMFSSQSLANDYFLNSYYQKTSARDETDYLSVQNTFAIEMVEGFRKWVKTGMRLFAKHELLQISLPDTSALMQRNNTNYITAGVQFLRKRGNLLNYDVLGEIRTTGTKWGEFNVEATIDTRIPLYSDSLYFKADGFIRNEMPSYYYSHYHGRNAWWDHSLNNIFRARIGGNISYRNSRIGLGLESIQNYVYLQELQRLTTATTASNNTLYGVEIMQSTSNIQVVSLNIAHRIKWGKIHWDNELYLQKSSSEKELSLPLLNVWSNLFFRFKIARVLNTEIGGDLRYFTSYYAPAYSPMVGLFAVQDITLREKIGNYPWINIYINFYLKGVRFYLAYSHVNSNNGRYFLVPHYPTNPRLLRFGISWTFYN